MTERGMIFNGEMVRALLDGRKTQTRRIMVPQPADDIERDVFPNPDAIGWKSSLKHKRGSTTVHFCPHGKPGDRIWVRETWAILGNEDGCCIDWKEKLCKADESSAARIYRASCEQRPGNYGLWSIPDDADWKPYTKDYLYEGAWRPSIHMPRWASRILLEITGVRVERLNSIGESDAIAEGLERYNDDGIIYYGPFGRGDCRPEVAYRDLWLSIYGAESWQANPWVWAIEFKRVEGGAA